MGKPGKKAGKGLLPPTNVARKSDPTKLHLRDQRTVKRLKMYTSKIKRDEKGTIVKGSVLSASDRTERSMARVAPDRRWFGNTRVIGQEALQQFRDEMGAKYRDPYSIVVKQSKLPLSLLEESKKLDSVRNDMQWDNTFGDKARRKRVKLGNTTLEEMASSANSKQDTYATGVATGVKRDRNLVREDEGVSSDLTNNRKLFQKGQSNRIWNELYKVVDSADVICYVLDARDPMGTRSPFLEEYMRKEKRYKHFIFVLNKCDLIPLWATARWLQILSKDYPTIAFHGDVNHPFGKGNLISLLRQFSRLHNVAHRGSRRTKNPISVGIVGYPNVGKSSVINTLRRKKVCKVAPIPGETKVWQYVALTRNIFLIDCPGIVYDREGNNDVQAVLKGVVRIERMGSADKTDVIYTVLEIVKKKDIVNTYGIPEWDNALDFLAKLATLRGKLLKGGQPDVDTAARMVLFDWQRGKVPWFNAPPYESHQQFKENKEMPESFHLKVIEHYNTFNVVDGEIKMGEAPDDEGAEEEEEVELEGSDVEEAVVGPAPAPSSRPTSKQGTPKQSPKLAPQAVAEEEGDDEIIWSKFMTGSKKRRKEKQNRARRAGL